MRRIADLPIRWALIGWIVLLLAYAAIQSYLDVAAAIPFGVPGGITLGFLGLSLVFAWIMVRQARGLCDARSDLILQLRCVERERDVLRAAFDASPDAIEVADVDRRFQLSNDRFSDWFQSYALNSPAPMPEETIRQRVARVTGDQAFQCWVTDLCENPDRIARRPVHFGEGPVREAECYSAPLRATDGVVIGRLFSYHDLGRETASARADRRRVATISHDLRTPLASVIGLAELLLLRGYSEAERQNFLRLLVDESRRLTSYIDDLIDLQRARSGSMGLDDDRSRGPEVETIARRP